ncbi:MAG: hypothetical protein AAF483_22350 [Planctomycetota bacterium]
MPEIPDNSIGLTGTSAEALKEFIQKQKDDKPILFKKVGPKYELGGSNFEPNDHKATKEFIKALPGLTNLEMSDLTETVDMNGTIWASELKAIWNNNNPIDNNQNAVADENNNNQENGNNVEQINNADNNANGVNNNNGNVNGNNGNVNGNNGNVNGNNGNVNGNNNVGKKPKFRWLPVKTVVTTNNENAVQRSFGMTSAELAKLLTYDLKLPGDQNVKVDVNIKWLDGKFDIQMNAKNKVTSKFELQPGNKWVVSDIKVEKPVQGHGIGKQWINGQLRIIDQLKAKKNTVIKKMTLQANFAMGAYAWAKFGFKPYSGDAENLADALKVRLEVLTDLNTAETQNAARQVRAIISKLSQGQGFAIDELVNLNTEVNFMTQENQEEPNETIRQLSSIFKNGKAPIGKAMLCYQKWNGKIDIDIKSERKALEKYTGFKTS